MVGDVTCTEIRGRMTYVILMTVWTRANFMNMSKNYTDGGRVFVHGAFSWLSSTSIVEVKGQVCRCALERIAVIQERSTGVTLKVRLKLLYSDCIKKHNFIELNALKGKSVDFSTLATMTFALLVYLISCKLQWKALWLQKQWKFPEFCEPYSRPVCCRF